MDSGGGMGGGAADLRLEPSVLEILRESPPPRLLLRGNGSREMASLPIPDELVAEIFLLLPTPADLVRASAACVSFRRVAAGRSFLRRFRELHARPLVGFFDQNKVFYPAIAPHPSASAASAVALAADFSFSFLPAPAPSSRWFVSDIRDGRVLLHKGIDSFSGMVDLVVCDPLHQQHLLLPPITCDLISSVDDPLWRKAVRRIETFFVPPGDEAGAAEETSFRVMWMANCEIRLVAFLFSSNSGQWRVISSRRWSDLTASLPPYGFSLRQYVYGCFYWYWTQCKGRKLLVLDTKTMEFSFAKLPPEASSCRDLAMVEAGEGRPGLFVLAVGRYDLSYFIRRNDGGSSIQWQKVKTISLGSWSRLICTMDKHLLLHKEQTSLLEASCFTLDIETFQLERVCALEYSFDFHRLHAYSNFPPSLLSSPTISSGVENKAEKEMLEETCAASSSAESHGQGCADANA